MKKIIGLVGPMASGKDVTKKYIEEKYGAKSVKFSQIIRDVLNRLRISIDRKNMQDLTMILIDRFGSDLLARNVAEDVKEVNADIVILDGVRRIDDILHAKDMGDFYLIGIDADPKIRYERMKLRNENEGDENKSYDEFMKEHEKGTEVEIPNLLEKADFVIDNNGSMEELYRQVDNIICKL